MSAPTPTNGPEASPSLIRRHSLLSSALKISSPLAVADTSAASAVSLLSSAVASSAVPDVASPPSVITPMAANNRSPTGNSVLAFLGASKIKVPAPAPASATRLVSSPTNIASGRKTPQKIVGFEPRPSISSPTLSLPVTPQLKSGVSPMGGGRSNLFSQTTSPQASTSALVNLVMKLDLAQHVVPSGLGSPYSVVPKDDDSGSGTGSGPSSSATSPPRLPNPDPKVLDAHVALSQPMARSILDAPIAAVRLQSYSKGTPPVTAQPSPASSPASSFQEKSVLLNRGQVDLAAALPPTPAEATLSDKLFASSLVEPSPLASLCSLPRPDVIKVFGTSPIVEAPVAGVRLQSFQCGTPPLTAQLKPLRDSAPALALSSDSLIGSLPRTQEASPTLFASSPLPEPEITATPAQIFNFPVAGVRLQSFAVGTPPLTTAHSLQSSITPPTPDSKVLAQSPIVEGGGVAGVRMHRYEADVAALTVEPNAEASDTFDSKAVSAPIAVNAPWRDIRSRGNSSSSIGSMTVHSIGSAGPALSWMSGIGLPPTPPLESVMRDGSLFASSASFASTSSEEVPRTTVSSAYSGTLHRRIPSASPPASYSSSPAVYSSQLPPRPQQHQPSSSPPTSSSVHPAPDPKTLLGAALVISAPVASVRLQTFSSSTPPLSTQPSPQVTPHTSPALRSLPSTNFEIGDGVFASSQFALDSPVKGMSRPLSKVTSPSDKYSLSSTASKQQLQRAAPSASQKLDMSAAAAAQSPKSPKSPKSPVSPKATIKSPLSAPKLSASAVPTIQVVGDAHANEFEQIFSYVSSVELPPITSTALAKKQNSRKPDAIQPVASTQLMPQVSPLGAHMKDAFARLPAAQRMMVLLLWRVCSSTDPRPISFLYHCVRFQQQGLLDNLDFLGASLPGVLSAAAAAGASTSTKFAGVAGLGNAAAQAASFFSAPSAASASESSIRRTISSPLLSKTARQAESSSVESSQGLVSPALSGLSASKHRVSSSPSLADAAQSTQPIRVARCEKHRQCRARQRCPLATPITASASPASMVSSNHLVGTEPWPLGLPVAAVQDGLANPTSTMAQLPGEMFRMLGADFGHVDAKLLDDGLTASEFKRNFEELGVLGKGSFGKVVRARKRLDGQVYAVKVVKFSSASSVGLLHQKPIREVQMLAQLPTHLNICRFYHAWLEPDWASMDSEPRTRVANDLGLNDFGVGVAAAASTPTNCQQTPSQRSMNQSCNNNLWSNTASASAASPPSIRFAEYNGAPGASTAPIDALNDGWDRATATQSDPAVMTDSTAMSVLDSTGVIRRNSSFQNARSVFGPPKPAAPPIKGNIHCCCCLGCDDNHVCAVPKIPTIVSPTNSSVKSDAAKLARRHKSSEDDGGFDFSQWGQGDDAEEEEDQGDENSESESDDSETSLESKPVAQPPIKPALGGVVPDEAARLSASSPPPLTSPSGPQSPSFNTTPGDQSTIRIDLEKTDGSFSPGSFYLQSSSTTRYVDRSKSASSAAAGNAKRQLPMTTEQISSPAASPLLSALPPSADASKSDTAACSPALKSTSNSALAVQNQQLPVYYAALAHLSKTMRFPVRLYIQMQLCESDTLATWLQNRNRRVNTEYSMRLWTQIVEGVRHMHAHGIVHRDIKPGNLFVEAVRPFAPPPSASPAVGARRQVSAASTTRAQVRLADSETEDSFSQPSSAPTSLAPSPMLPVARPHTSPGLWSLNSMQVEQASPALPPLAPRRTPTQAAASPSQGPRPSSPAHMLVSAANSASLTFTADSFPFIVKIGDFGLAKDLSAHFEADLPASSAAPNVSTSPFLPSSNQRSAQKGPVRLVGTKTYASPEQLAGSSVLSTQTDMYSLGVILFEMFFVFGTAMERARVLSELRTRRSLPAGFEAEYPAVARLVLWLLQERPEARPSAAELLCDPFVRQYAPSHAPHLTPPLQPSRGALFGTPSTPVGGATSAQLSTMSHDELVAAVQSRDQMIDQMQAMMRKQQEELDALRSRMS